MALRVLLADESTTIKKVMQLALQDFAVEVKSVHTGVDVVEVARAFKPDIVFCDVLLQKKNGYEVAADLKRHPELKSVPLVLMWSSFMELDEDQAAKTNADRRLEKPFDVAQLRQVITELVPRTRSSRLAQFLEHPQSLSESLREGPPRQAVTPLVSPKGPPAPPPSRWSADSFEEIGAFGEREEFRELKLASSAPKETPNPETAPEEVEENWSHQDLSRFKIELPPVSIEDDDITLKIPQHDPDLEGDASALTTATEQGFRMYDLPPVPDLEESIEIDLPPSDPSVDPSVPEPEDPYERTTPPDIPTSIHIDVRDDDDEFDSRDDNSATIPQLSADRLEAIVRAQSREIIEAVVRRIVPDIATDIIRAELQRLLEDGPS